MHEDQALADRRLLSALKGYLGKVGTPLAGSRGEAVDGTEVERDLWSAVVLARTPPDSPD